MSVPTKKNSVRKGVQLHKCLDCGYPFHSGSQVSDDGLWTAYQRQKQTAKEISHVKHTNESSAEPSPVFQLLGLTRDLHPLDNAHDDQAKKRTPRISPWGSQSKKAATYSPALHCSTIGATGLNFSVRNGKRWDPGAITT